VVEDKRHAVHRRAGDVGANGLRFADFQPRRTCMS
jgi:hypothetical protein